MAQWGRLCNACRLTHVHQCRQKCTLPGESFDFFTPGKVGADVGSLALLVHQMAVACPTRVLPGAGVGGGAMGWAVHAGLRTPIGAGTVGLCLEAVVPIMPGKVRADVGKL